MSTVLTATTARGKPRPPHVAWTKPRLFEQAEAQVEAGEIGECRDALIERPVDDERAGR